MKTQLITTTENWGATAIRFALGIVLFSHGAQSMLGWFGGFGLQSTIEFLSANMGLPALIGYAVICIQFFGSLMLVTGLLTRVAALGVFGIFIGMATYHFDYGFYMNWSGTNAGEGFEYHILVLAMCVMLFISGGGALSVDYKILKSHPL
ncbi:DoxX family membrane protein [Runella sp. CRIBMP]|uniref:DoxX family protein n=1 Tax=Runella aurantiaca TaxID=2282308 RepID=A0A369I270_9BACT|nr:MULTISPECIES: DoxX family protein [Runella]NBB22993.1 DoxX family membrane protein [Runella sp. CRIBMP]RDB02577.1 DoxX family protein [Runella aurantiaca]